MATAPAAEAPATPGGGGRTRKRRGNVENELSRQAVPGWIFLSPSVILLLLFLVIPVIMALWVSVSDWNGRGSPFSSNVSFVGAENYQSVLGGKGLAARDFGHLHPQQPLLRPLRHPDADHPVA